MTIVFTASITFDWCSKKRCTSLRKDRGLALCAYLSIYNYLMRPCVGGKSVKQPIRLLIQFAALVLSVACTKTGNLANTSDATSTLTNGSSSSGTPPPPASSFCPVSGSTFTGTWSNGGTTSATIAAIAITGNVITMFKTPCGEIMPAAAVVQSDGSFTYNQSGLVVSGHIANDSASGTISSSTCTTQQSWSMARFSNEARGLVVINKISAVNAAPRTLVSAPAGLVDSALSAVGLFPVGSQVNLSLTSGTVTYWGPFSCYSSASCTFTVAPGVATYQITVQ